MSAPVPRLPTPKPVPARPSANYAALHVALACDGDVGTRAPGLRALSVADVECLAAEAERWEAVR